MATSTASAPAAHSGRLWRNIRRFSNALIVIGVAILLYAGVILAWGDPVTWVWAHWQQRALTSQFHEEQRAFQHGAPPPSDAPALAAVRADALAFRRTLKEAHAFGRLTFGRIGLSKVVSVQVTTA